jgi:hypothetical protein
LINLSKLGALFFQPLKNIFQPFLCFSAEISAPWATISFRPSGEKCCRQKHKKSAKTFSSSASPYRYQFGSALSNEKPEINTCDCFVCEDDIKVKNRYFATK